MGSQARLGRITLHNEVLLEVWELKQTRCSESTLERPECRLGLHIPSEPFLTQQSGQRRGDGTEIFDEPVIVADEAKECPHGVD
jgi:hypothetical protein